DLPALTETEEWERRGQQRLPMPDEPCFLDDGEPLEPPTRVTLPRRYHLGCAATRKCAVPDYRL
ncbi:hypothetical protein, partial [Staphylococcus aureus]|uniref:hypothetical protein n=1 Tax=Staphylococcus aureus TaxID=1280 RepID=UPI003F5C093F